jgi:hypothetical protein
MAFYVALCTGRALLVDWESPVPLSRFLEPNLVEWNATAALLGGAAPAASVWAIDQWDNPYVRDPYTLPADRDVDLAANQYVGQGLIERSRCHRDYLSRFPPAGGGGGGSGAPSSAGGGPVGGGDEYYRAAFWTLFKWSPLVLEGTDRLRRELGLAGGGGGAENRTAGGGGADGSSLHDHHYPYVAVHLRTGKLNHTGDFWLGQTSNESAWPLYYECAAAFQRGLRERVRAACAAEGSSSASSSSSPPTVPIYLATDTVPAKRKFLEWDRDVRTKPGLEVYHFDLTRGEVLGDAEQAALDVFRELKLLVDSTCLVMTRNLGDPNNGGVSKYSRMANWLATPRPRCAAYWDDCGPDVVEGQLSRLGGGRVRCPG